MDHLSKLTLQGYFEQLRSNVSELSQVRKGAIKAKGRSKSKENPVNKLLELLIKSVALVEEIHQNDSEFLHEDHLNDYRQMITTLNEHGIAYKGNEEILNLENKPFLDFMHKKPMQKAAKKAKSSKSTNTKRKAG